MRMPDDKAPPAVTWLFDMLATVIANGLGLMKQERRHQAFLVLSTVLLA